MIFLRSETDFAELRLVDRFDCDTCSEIVLIRGTQVHTRNDHSMETLTLDVL